jgi:superfamily II DNA or RNA helicase
MNLNNQPEINGKEVIYTVKDFDLPTYEDLIVIRSLPDYQIIGNQIAFRSNYLNNERYEQGELPLPLSNNLFDYQQIIAKVAYHKERYGIFADPGLGKTFVLGELCRQVLAAHDGKAILCVDVNILHQFEEMVIDFFPDFPEFIHLHNNKRITLEEWCEYGDERVAFINHEGFLKERHLKNVIFFGLDEASILKGGQGGNGKIAKNIIKSTLGIRYKYAASGTPAPNDRTEYAMIAQFLEIVRTEFEFYSLFFTIKDDKYVLKRHATEAFYRYLASFSIFIRNPKSYGFADSLAALKPWKEIYRRVDMTEEQLKVIGQWATKGKQALIPGVATKPRGMTQRGKFSQISKGFVYNTDKATTLIASNKPKVISEIVQSHLPEQVLIWTVFDEEGEIIKRELDKLGVKVCHITGKMKQNDRIENIDLFRHGKLDVIISKPRILGFGLNFQFCRVAIYSGLQDSFELYYQSVKRIHRYGQDKQCLIYHVYTQYEEAILQNVLGKKKQMEQDFAYQERLYISSLYDELKEWLELENYKPMEVQTMSIKPVLTDNYELYHGDSIKILTEIANDERHYSWLRKNSIDLSIFSPPFMGDVFTYTNDPADMGNTRGAGAQGGLDEFMLQFQFFLHGMLAVTKPGRIMAMHLEDVPLRKNLDGSMGLFDFVGQAIMEANKAGWILIAKIPILKNQQMTAIVKKVHSLTMTNMEKDRLRIAPCINGHLCLFRKPGESKVKVADIARCEACNWQGYANNLIGWQPTRQYKSDWLLDADIRCPNCQSENVFVWSEMDGNKWVIYAEGTWPENGFDNYDKSSQIPQEKRWLDLVYTALGVWPDITESDTLQNPFHKADEADADKHLCPLPLSIARRAIELYTLPGEIVLTPFAGIGTEIDQAIRLNRKAIGIELKPEYFMQAAKAADKAVFESTQMTLFDLEAFKV